MSTIKVGAYATRLATARASRLGVRLGDHELIDVPVTPAGETGGLRAALLAGEVDLIVHACETLPVEAAAGIRIAAYPKRGDARDALCTVDGSTLDDLPEGARVGTDSALRRAELLAARPDLDIVHLGGEAAAHLDRLTAAADDDRLDAVIVSVADLELLGESTKGVRLDRSDWPTAPGQGALAVEVRTDAPREVVRRVEALDHRTTRLTTSAERGVLAELGVEAASAVGAIALLDDGLLFLTASVYALDGSSSRTSSHAAYPEDTADPAAELAGRVAKELLELGVV